MEEELEGIWSQQIQKLDKITPRINQHLRELFDVMQDHVNDTMDNAEKCKINDALHHFTLAVIANESYRDEATRLYKVESITQQNWVDIINISAKAHSGFIELLTDYLVTDCNCKKY